MDNSKQLLAAVWTLWDVCQHCATCGDENPANCEFHREEYAALKERVESVLTLTAPELLYPADGED
jgi:hypothetical protein